MAAAFRISKASRGTSVLGGSRGEASALAAVEPSGVNEYLEKLVKMIPTEVVGLYLVGSGVIPTGQNAYLLGWALFCFVAVIVVRSLGTRDVESKKGPQWAAVVISSSAFVIWIYSMGGPFQAYLGNDYEPFVGSLLVLAWTFVVPLLYKPTD